MLLFLSFVPITAAAACPRLLTPKVLTCVYCSPPFSKIIELGGNSRHVFGFKGLKGEVFQNQRLTLSKSAENGFEAASRAGLVDGAPLHCPNQIFVISEPGLEVCDGGH